MQKMKRRLASMLGKAALLTAVSGAANAALIIEIDFDLSTLAPDVTAVGAPAIGATNLNIANAAYSDATGNSVFITAFSGAPGKGSLTDIEANINIQDGVNATIRIFEDNFVLGSPTSIVSSSITPTVVGSATTTVTTSVDGTAIINAETLVQGVDLNGSILATLANPSTIEHFIRIVNNSGSPSNTTFDTTTEVPEPSIAALLGVGLLGFTFFRRRNRTV